MYGNPFHLIHCIRHFDRFQNVEKEVSVLLMEKEIAVNKLQDADDTIQELRRNLEKRENRIRSLTEKLLKYVNHDHLNFH